MGDVVGLRDYAPRAPRQGHWNDEPATVIVLPVIRIERHFIDPDEKIDLPVPADPRFWIAFDEVRMDELLCLTRPLTKS